MKKDLYNLLLSGNRKEIPELFYDKLENYRLELENIIPKIKEKAECNKFLELDRKGTFNKYLEIRLEELRDDYEWELEEYAITNCDDDDKESEQELLKRMKKYYEALYILSK